MASDKKPSIYSDRSTIGSSDELDEYGVWVKSEPQDLSPASTETPDSADFSGTVMDELPDFDAGFDEDGQSGFAEDNFEVPDLDIPEALEPESGSPAEDTVELIDFEDLSTPDESPAAPSGDEGFTEVAMEDFLDESPEEAVLPMVEEAVEPAVEESVLPAAEPELAAAEPIYGTQEREKTSGGTDLSTQLLMKIAGELSSIRNELSTLKKEFSAVQRESAGEDKGDAQKKGFFDEEDDEKIALTGDELDNILNTADFTEEAGADATEELPGVFPSPEDGGLIPSDSTQVIEESALPDLLSDQEDIIGPEAELEAEDLSLPELEEEEGGEEDDIAIDLDFDSIDPESLSEESLPPPESPAGEKISLDAEEFDINMDSPLEDSPEEAAASEEMFDLPGEDALELAEPGDDFSLPGEVLDETEELQILREEGAKPLTPPPEDTSYLDEEAPDSPAEESAEKSGLDESVLDLSGAVIDEPDLSTEITDIPLEEPSLDEFSLDEEEGEEAGDIVIDLDFEDSPAGLSAEESPAEAVEDEPEISLPAEEEALNLDIPEERPAEELSLPGEENFAQVIPEGFEVEADDSRGPLDEDLEEDILSEGDIDTLEKSSGVLDTDELSGGAEAAESALADEDGLNIPNSIKQELKTVLSYMDQLLESLPEDKIEEFAKSEYFDTYKKLFKELGLD
jgi:hypothetical protein